MKFLCSVLLGVSLIGVGCASAPPAFTPEGQIVWKAREAQSSLGVIQSTAIALNKVQVCDPAPCHPLLSDDNTRIVIVAVRDGVKTLQAVPAGWKTTALAVVDQIDARLDQFGKEKLKTWTAAARVVITGL
jgi:hypothetical protein